jgi:hypothetical protein
MHPDIISSGASASKVYIAMNQQLLYFFNPGRSCRKCFNKKTYLFNHSRYQGLFATVDGTVDSLWQVLNLVLYFAPPAAGPPAG